MTDQALVDRLAALKALAAIPREQLEWLVAHGQLRRFAKGERAFTKGQQAADLYIVLSGRLSIRVVRGGVPRLVKEWKGGDVTGVLPYSRMTAPPGDAIADEPVEALMVPGGDVRNMIRECYEFTSHCVHEMLDRARLFKSDDLHFEKMMSLGRLAAGLAHELNNPTAALARSAKLLVVSQGDLVSASRALGEACLEAAQLASVEALRLEAEADIGEEARTPLARADRQDEISQWLDDHGIDPTVAESLADSGATRASLDGIARLLDGSALDAALRYVAADATARRLTTEIEMAASRVHSLVAAVKSFTRMDRAPVVEAVDIGANLKDVLTLLRAKARAKSLTVSIDVPSDLPAVPGFGGELNQVWSNLIDNAMDAAPASGHVTVTATSEPQAVVVGIVDDGAGIPEENRERIFEPFFTTKPVGEGTGLGLEIAQGIVGRHGGSIDYDSRPGHTEFRVRLPITQGERS